MTPHLKFRPLTSWLLATALLASFISDVAAQGGGGRGRGGQRGGGAAPAGPRPTPDQLNPADGVASIPDRATFEALAYQGPNPGVDTYLAGLQFVKYIIMDPGTENQVMYIMNTKRYQGHPTFMRGVGLGGFNNGEMRGALTYRPLVNAPDGGVGVYTFDYEPEDSFPFARVKLSYDMLLEKMPFLKGRLVYHPLQGALARYQLEKNMYEAAGLPVYLDEKLYSDIGFLPLNEAASFGRLRLMDGNELPSPRDIVLYRQLPNEIPRVAGMITDVPQTPLAHVNLRAVQDKVPNAFIKRASELESIKGLIGKPVSYKVTANGYELRAATTAEMDQHFASLRPAEPQSPKRDLAITTVLPLGEIAFAQSTAFGVKAANLAAMRKFGLPEGTVPDGFAVPFYFYDAFMRHNNFYDYARKLIGRADFREKQEVRETELTKFRQMIEKGTMPADLMAALAKTQASFPTNSGIRCRSSSNSEDLPGFNGAGLYDSFTHRPDEGHLASSIQQVYASLWNLRAFEEREFYRIDHFATAMAVLLHSNFDDERANGVAVTRDILYQTARNGYVNVQLGEDLVTNPEAQSIPEEVLLGWTVRDGQRYVRQSNRLPDGTRLLSSTHLSNLRGLLEKIHVEFAKLYGASADASKFAMDVEFKITKAGQLVVKQARPWVY